MQEYSITSKSLHSKLSQSKVLSVSEVKALIMQCDKWSYISLWYKQ